MTIKIYQTLEDRNNPQEIVSDGPFGCKRSDAWLGNGFYFWENYFEHAKWWGSKGCNDNYVICSAFYDNNESFCFNLIDNYEHLEFLEELNLAVKAKRRKPVYIPQLIELLKRQGLFKYDAIRAPSLEAISDPLYVKYKPKHKARIFLRPLNQVCFIKKKNRLNLRDYKIVYPSHYVEGYVI